MKRRIGDHGGWGALFSGVALLGIALAAVALAQEPWNAPERAKKKQNPLPADSAAIATGRKLYEMNCLSCHGRLGRGDGPAASDLERSPGDLTDGERMSTQTDGELFWKITEGRKPMPTFKKALTEEERWQIVHYVRTLVKDRK